MTTGSARPSPGLRPESDPTRGENETRIPAIQRGFPLLEYGGIRYRLRGKSGRSCSPSLTYVISCRDSALSQSVLPAPGHGTASDGSGSSSAVSRLRPPIGGSQLAGIGPVRLPSSIPATDCEHATTCRAGKALWRGNSSAIRPKSNAERQCPARMHRRSNAVGVLSTRSRGR